MGLQRQTHHVSQWSLSDYLYIHICSMNVQQGGSVRYTSTFYINPYISSAAIRFLGKHAAFLLFEQVHCVLMAGLHWHWHTHSTLSSSHTSVQMPRSDLLRGLCSDNRLWIMCVCFEEPYQKTHTYHKRPLSHSRSHTQTHIIISSRLHINYECVYAIF